MDRRSSSISLLVSLNLPSSPPRSVICLSLLAQRLVSGRKRLRAIAAIPVPVFYYDTSPPHTPLPFLRREGSIVAELVHVTLMVTSEFAYAVAPERSEERRVGKECRSWWSS